MAARTTSPSVPGRALRRSRPHLLSLVELATRLEEAGDADAVTLALVEHAGRLGFGRCAVLGRQRDRWRGTVGDRHPVLVESRAAPGPAVERALSTGRPELVARLEQEGIAGIVLPHASGVVVRPLCADDEVLGVALAAWDRRAGSRIPTVVAESLAHATGSTAAALARAWRAAETERLATRDGLTGLPNRRLFDESINREIARADRLRTPLSLVLLDVDCFKVVNDTFGHPAGDAVLRDVGCALTENTKASDLACRWGGDEFVVLLPDCSADDAVGVAERLRAAVARRVTIAPVTISAGTATVPDHADGAGRLIAAADAALYEAKRNGRDRSARSARLPLHVRAAPPVQVAG